MKKTINHIFLSGFTVIFAGMILSPSSAVCSVNASYLYNLADFNGAIPYDSPRIFIDADRSETYVLYMNSVDVFNDAGMEIYRFSYEAEARNVLDLAVDDRGDILTLSYQGANYHIERRNYRGEARQEVVLGDLPAEFRSFAPGRLVCRKGSLLLADLSAMKIVVTDEEGRFQKAYDLGKLLELREQDRANTGISGFSVDAEGNILFTIPVLFSAFRLTPGGALSSFGQPGSTPGKFNIVGGIVADNRGNYLVTDVLKSVIMVFDRDFRFLTQFGAYGTKPGELIGPKDLRIDARDRLYVTQGRKRGVSVFRLAYD